MTLDSTAERRDILDSLWWIANDTRVIAGLLCLLAATLAVAASFPQQPAGLDAAAAEQWQVTTVGAYRGVGSILEGLGVFGVTSGVWLRVLLAVIGYLLLVRLAVAAQEAVRASRAGQRGLGAIGPLMVYLGALSVLAGLLLESAAGWRTIDITLEPGSHAALPRDGGSQLALQQVAGPEPAAIATLALKRPGHITQTLQIAYGQPARPGGVWVVLQGTGASLTVSATSGNRPLLLQSLAVGGEISEEIHIPFRQAQPEQAFAIPANNLTFRAVSYPALPDKSINRPVFLVEAYRGDVATPVVSRLVENEAALIVDDVICTLRRDRHIVVAAGYLPGLLPIVSGALFILVGLLIALGLGRSQARGEARAGETGISMDPAGAAPASAAPASETPLASQVSDFRVEMVDPASSPAKDVPSREVADVG